MNSKYISNINISNNNILIFDPSISSKSWCSSNIIVSNGKWQIYEDYYKNIILIKNGYKNKIDNDNWEISTNDFAIKSGFILFFNNDVFNEKNLIIKNENIENFEFEIQNITQDNFFIYSTTELKNHYTIQYQYSYKKEIIAIFIENDKISVDKINKNKNKFSKKKK
jgi:hypothetical protein